MHFILPFIRKSSIIDKDRLTFMATKAAKLSILIFSLLLNFNLTLASDYKQVAGLIDLRTTFSDGSLDPESLVKLAQEKGFDVVFFTDHDRLVMEYGIFPFRNILKKRVELNSINKGGAENYLNKIRESKELYPGMILIPGSETVPFYYWKGSYFKKDLTAHNHERRILTIGLERTEDYRDLPIIHNGSSTGFTATSLPIVFVFFVPLILGVFLVRWRGIYRIFGILICVLSIFAIINANPFRGFPFDQYHGDQGMAPYQLLIDYVNQKGGMTFWNYPETRSGIRKMGPIFLNTPPYPEVLEESKGYTGFAAIYGDNITVTGPGNIWDKVLLAYCKGERDNPVWGIATADFHKEGESGQRLGDFPTVFFIKEKTKEEILSAMRQGRMYACRGRYPQRIILDEFSIYSSLRKIRGISGQEIILIKENPRVRISLSALKPTRELVKVRVIRSGEVIKSFEGELPMEIDFEDNYLRPGQRIYYRMDVHGIGTLVSNPIFVSFE